MSERPDTIIGAFPRATLIARWTTAIVCAGGLASVFWMFLIQEGYEGQILRRTWTEHDFTGGLGNALGADEPARVGVFATLGLGIVLTIVFVAVERFLPGRDWRKGLSFAPLPFLVWGLVYCPLVDSRRLLAGDAFAYFPSGLFGVEAGVGTIASAAIASLVASILIARITPMMRDASWWVRHPDAMRRVDHEELFEFSEERSEQGVERAG